MGFFDKVGSVASGGFSDLTSGDPKKMIRGAVAPGVSQGFAAGKAIGIKDPLDPEVQNSRTQGGSNGFDQMPQEFNRQGFDVNAYKIDPNIGVDPSKYGNQLTSIETLRTRANSAEDSPWLKMQLEKQGIEEAQGKSAAAQAGMAGQAQARAGLAMRGGLSGGARERLATSGARDIAAAQQGVGAAGTQNRLGLQIKEEDTKLDLQKALPGQDLQRSQFLAGIEAQNNQNKINAGQFNAQLAQQENNAANNFGQNKYGQQMAGYAANKSGAAIANSGGGKK